MRVRTGADARAGLKTAIAAAALLLWLPALGGAAQQMDAAYPKLDRPEVLQYLFHPRKEPPSAPPEGAADLSIAADTGAVITCRFHIVGPGAPAILFFHGNGETVEDYGEIAYLYSRLGISLLAAEYRGYGRSTGAPTASAMIRDAHTIFSKVKKWRAAQKHTGPLFIMGRSLGSASALELAARYEADTAGLIIESGFAYTEPLLRFLGVDTKRLGITEADCFDQIAKVRKYKKPLLVIHARHDQFIPVSDAETLVRECPSGRKQLQIVPHADHNSILRAAGTYYFKFIKDFIDGK